MMVFVDLSIKRIREFLRSSGLSKNRLAQEAGLRESTLRNMHRDGWSPSAATLRRLEKAIPHDFMPPDDPGDQNNAGQ